MPGAQTVPCPKCGLPTLYDRHLNNKECLAWLANLLVNQNSKLSFVFPEPGSCPACGGSGRNKRTEMFCAACMGTGNRPEGSQSCGSRARSAENRSKVSSEGSTAGSSAATAPTYATSGAGNSCSLPNRS